MYKFTKKEILEDMNSCVLYKVEGKINNECSSEKSGENVCQCEHYVNTCPD